MATLFDDDGILVRFMNNNVEGNGIRDSTSAQQLISQVQFNGMTPLVGILATMLFVRCVFSYLCFCSLWMTPEL